MHWLHGNDADRRQALGILDARHFLRIDILDHERRERDAVVRSSAGRNTRIGNELIGDQTAGRATVRTRRAAIRAPCGGDALIDHGGTGAIADDDAGDGASFDLEGGALTGEPLGDRMRPGGGSGNVLDRFDPVATQFQPRERCAICQGELNGRIAGKTVGAAQIICRCLFARRQGDDGGAASAEAIERRHCHGAGSRRRARWLRGRSGRRSRSRGAGGCRHSGGTARCLGGRWDGRCARW